MTAAAMQQVLKWYAKRKIRERCPSRIADQLLGEQGAIHQLWSIGIVTGASPLRLRHAPGGLNPVLTREDVSDVRALFRRGSVPASSRRSVAHVFRGIQF
jgi:hypothetical protein